MDDLVDGSRRAANDPGTVAVVRSEMSAAMQRQRRLYEAILDNTPDLAYVFDRQHRFLYANRALLQLWGRTWDEAIGRTCLELGYEPWHAEMHDREIDQVIATREPVRGVVPFTGTSGRRVYDYVFVPVFGDDGEVEAVAGTTRDVTELKANEDALREADRRKDEFLATLAHELRNPLAPLRNCLSILDIDDGGQVDRRQLYEVMERQVGQLVHLVDDLLDISRITSGKVILRPFPVQVGSIVERAVETSRPLIDGAAHRLDVHVEDPGLVLHGDPVRLAQVLSNLLNNAATYTEPGGRIELSARREGSVAVMRVRDTGAGIDPADLERVFEPFAQSQRSIARAQGGLGIGLTLVRSLVALHGGTVEARSAGLGHGSEFVVCLPIG